MKICSIFVIEHNILLIMIPEKKDSECVSFPPEQFCDEDKAMIVEKQEQFKKLNGTRIGKAKAVKELLSELRECRLANETE